MEYATQTSNQYVRTDMSWYMQENQTETETQKCQTFQI